MVEKCYKPPFPIVKSSCLIRTEGFLYGKNTAVLHYVAFTGSDVLFLFFPSSLPPSLPPALHCPHPPHSSHSNQVHVFRPHVTHGFRSCVLNGMACLWPGVTSIMLEISVSSTFSIFSSPSWRF